MDTSTLVGEEAPRKLQVKDMTEHPLEVVKADYGSFWKIKRVGGGHVPLPIQGMYTCEAYAQRALDEYK